MAKSKMAATMKPHNGMAKQSPDSPVKKAIIDRAATPRIREAMKSGHRAGRTYEVYDPVKHAHLGGMKP